jgi:hypothetical protein
MYREVRERMEKSKDSIVDKILTGKCLTDEEVEFIVDCGLSEYSFSEEEGESSRWEQSMTTILKINDRYFAIDWERGLTEMQENYYDSQIAKEVIPVTKTITVTEWKEKNPPVKDSSVECAC